MIPDDAAFSPYDSVQQVFRWLRRHLDQVAAMDGETTTDLDWTWRVLSLKRGSRR